MSSIYSRSRDFCKAEPNYWACIVYCIGLKVCEGLCNGWVTDLLSDPAGHARGVHLLLVHHFDGNLLANKQIM